MNRTNKKNSFVEKDSNSEGRLVWIDLEMTGLDIDKDVVIEIATIVTDYDLEIVNVGPNIAIKQPIEKLLSMNDWNQITHKDSGLYSKVIQSQIHIEEAEEKTLSFLKQELQHKVSPMCGNSICTDRRFLQKYMPKLESFFHYRQIDVSSIKELVKYWYPSEFSLRKKTTHTALQDIYDSINELKYYRSFFFVKPPSLSLDDDENDN